MKTGNSRLEYVCTAVLLISLLLYLLLRAWYVVPMHDEIATFFHYIESGKIFELGMVFDANNHFFNSYLGRFFYLIGLDHYFFYRLGNVLAFVLYFFGIRKMIQPVFGAFWRFILLAACTCVPFVLEYFAYSRGYGMGMAFFVWVLYFAQKLITEASISNTFKLAFFTFFMLFSNLIFTGTFCLVLLLLVLVFLKSRKSYSKKEKVQFLGVLAALLLSVSPLLAYSFFLKKIGALYYGSLAGLWEVTGKSLSTVVFFTDSQFVKWILSFLLVAGLMFYLYKWVKSKFWDFLLTPENILAVFFFGNLSIILILALVLRVNYPEDRAGMYLVPLFILLAGFRLQASNKSKPFMLLLLFFPLTLLTHLSFSTSVFSPDVRMSSWFYERVRKQLSEEKNLVLYPTMHLSWHWFERQQQTKIFPNVSAEFDPEFDVIITREERLPKDWNRAALKLIAHDKETGHIALVHRHPCKKWKVVQIFPGDSFMEPPIGNKPYPILNIPIQKEWYNRRIEVVLTGKLQQSITRGNLTLEIKTLDGNGEQIRFDLLEQSWYLGQSTEPKHIQIRQLFTKIKPNEKKLSVYLLNGSDEPVNFSNRRIEIYTIEADYGTR